MIETHLGNMGFMYAVYVEEDFIEEFKTPAKARKEAREITSLIIVNGFPYLQM